MSEWRKTWRRGGNVFLSWKCNLTFKMHFPKKYYYYGSLKWNLTRICLQCRRPGFDPWVGKIPWKRERLPTSVFWDGESHGLYSPWGRKELDMTKRLSVHFNMKLEHNGGIWHLINSLDTVSLEWASPIQLYIRKPQTSCFFFFFFSLVIVVVF